MENIEIYTDGIRIFGRENECGDIEVLTFWGGEAVTKLEESIKPMVYPVDSNRSCYYEHPNGLVLSREDAEKIGLEIEAYECR